MFYIRIDIAKVFNVYRVIEDKEIKKLLNNIISLDYSKGEVRIGMEVTGLLFESLLDI